MSNVLDKSFIHRYYPKLAYGSIYGQTVILHTLPLNYVVINCMSPNSTLSSSLHNRVCVLRLHFGMELLLFLSYTHFCGELL